MTAATARRELRAARADGFCGCCGARADPGGLTPRMHNDHCKVVNDACLRRRPR